MICRSHRVCGVNIGVGYHHYHTPQETLRLAEWEHTYRCLTAFLEKEQPRFPISRSRRLRSLLRRMRGVVAKGLKKLLKK